MGVGMIKDFDSFCEKYFPSCRVEKFIVKKSVCDKFREKVHNLIRELELEELKKESPNER